MDWDTLEVEMANTHATNGRRKMDPYEDLFPTPAARLGFLIRDRGTKQKDLAAMLGVSAPYISTVVAGDKGLDPMNWVKMAEHFGVTVDWLLCRKGAPMYWPANGTDDEGIAGISKQADEAARIVDGVTPRKRDEMLGVLRAMSFSVQLADLDADETTKRLADSLASAGIILSAKALDAVRATLFAFALGLGPNERDG